MRSSAAVMSWRSSQVLASQCPAVHLAEREHRIIEGDDQSVTDLASRRELGPQVRQHLGAFRAYPVHPATAQRVDEPAADRLGHVGEGDALHHRDGGVGGRLVQQGGQVGAVDRDRVRAASSNAAVSAATAGSGMDGR